MPQDTDAERIAAVEELQLLDAPPEERFDRIVRLAKHIFDVPMAGLNLVGDHRQYTLSGDGLEPGESKPLEQTLCAITVADERILEIPDLHADDAWRDHHVRRDGEVRFYAGAPLHGPGGQRVGALCLVDTQPRPPLTPAQRTALSDMAAWLDRELTTSADLEQGAELQRRLLPSSIPDLPGWDLAGRCVQAGAVGGDFYDWQVLRRIGQVQVMLADIMGKGLQAALLAAGVRAIARGASPHNTLSATLRRIADDTGDDLSEMTSFVTLFAARFDPADGAMEYVDAGHGLAFVVGPDRAVRLATAGMPVGALPDDSWESHPGRLSPGEALVLVSDGMLDAAEDADGVLRLAAEALAATDSAEAMVDRLVADATASTRTTDDVTVVVVRRDG